MNTNCLLLGDNMLTAVSVARDCGMVGPSHTVGHLILSFTAISTKVVQEK